MAISNVKKLTAKFFIANPISASPFKATVFFSLKLG